MLLADFAPLGGACCCFRLRVRRRIPRAHWPGCAGCTGARFTRWFGIVGMLRPMPKILLRAFFCICSNTTESYRPTNRWQVNMEDRHTCPTCGTEFSGAMKFCPVCMLRQALGRKSDSDEPAPVSGRLEHYELVTDEHGKPISWVGVQWVSLI